MRAIDAYNREAELQPQFLNPNNYLVDFDNEGNPYDFRDPLDKNFVSSKINSLPTRRNLNIPNGVQTPEPFMYGPTQEEIEFMNMSRNMKAYGGQAGYLPMAFGGRDMQEDLGRNNYMDDESIDVSSNWNVDSGMAADASMYGAQWLTKQANQIRNSDPLREQAKFDTVNQYGSQPFPLSGRGFYDDRGNMMAPNQSNQLLNYTDSDRQNINRIFAAGVSFDLGEDYDLTDEEIAQMEAAGYKIKRM